MLQCGFATSNTSEVIINTYTYIFIHIHNIIKWYFCTETEQMIMIMTSVLSIVK